MLGALWFLNRERQRDAGTQNTSARETLDRIRAKASTSPGSGATDESDLNALARMLASESSDEGVQVVIGWLTIQHATRIKQTIHAALTRGRGYGHQDRKDGVSYYASTAEDATPATTRMAERLLAGSVVPAAVIRQTRSGAWVQRKQGVTDERMLEKQVKWKEGIWAQLHSRGKPTGWVLYSSEKPPIQISPFLSAGQRLDALPAVEALDDASRMVA